MCSEDSDPKALTNWFNDEVALKGDQLKRIVRYFKAWKENVKKAQRIIEDAWNNPLGERIYLGEWHTHPESTPTPSIDDRKLLINMLQDTRMEIEFLLMIIIGQNDNYVGVQQKGKKVIESLSRVTSTDGIEITIYKDSLEKISGFKVNGFINFAPIGYDIFCTRTI
ncbi:Mov34/MPN/PAD-1 family protein [Neobacillus niacini]|uniref:Mov34/MPN/PAD-1 family protein n=1 Tax=Neobacillus niacini TaxID=86668 RepID=UPI0005EFAC96|nr:Mov34/MPN/PAD-1 family protein [Neobacillus niacini]